MRHAPDRDLRTGSRLPFFSGLNHGAHFGDPARTELGPVRDHRRMRAECEGEASNNAEKDRAHPRKYCTQSRGAAETKNEQVSAMRDQRLARGPRASIFPGEPETRSPLRLCASA